MISSHNNKHLTTFLANLSLALLILNSCKSPQPLNINVNGFYKPAKNPIISADSSYTFQDPIKKATVHWQAADVFNPAAIVKDGKVMTVVKTTCRLLLKQLLKYFFSTRGCFKKSTPWSPPRSMPAIT